MILEPGDRVVHPQYGVGLVARLENREFEPGVIQRYYQITISSGTTVWVPLDLSISGLRKLAARNELVRCRRILGSHPSPLVDDARARKSVLSARLKQGTIAVQCEVVRDLSAYGVHKPISGTFATFLETTQNVLCQEWAEVEGITPLEASSEIHGLLEKSKLALTDTQT